MNTDVNNQEKETNPNDQIVDNSEETIETSTEATDKNEKEADPKADSKFSFKKKKNGKEKELEEKIEELTQQLAEQKDQFLRLFSEFDNYKKRTSKEKIDTIRNASEDLIVAMLPILDDFNRAMTFMETSTDINAIKEGETLIFNKFKNLLQQKGLKEMECVGEAFNSDIHEAVAQMPVAEEDKKNLICAEAEKGYYLNDKVIRYAKVVVAV